MHITIAIWDRMRNGRHLPHKHTQMRTLFAAALCCCIASCTSNNDPAQSLKDDLGRTIRLSVSPERVTTLAPSVTELIFAAGAGHKIAGVTTADDYPPAIMDLPRFSALPVDFEAIVELDPDLIFASDQINSPNDASTFDAVGIPVYFVSVSSLDDVMRVVRDIGALLNTPDLANHAADSLTRSLEHLKSLTRNLSHRPSTLFLISDVTLYSFGRNSYIHKMIDIAGGRSITAHMATRGPVLTDEFVLAEQPEVIVGAFGPEYQPNDLLIHHPAWDVLNAIATGRVYGFEASVFVRPGPRLIGGAWQLARKLHPDFIPVQ